jgi:hypothetical protein
MNMAWAKQLAMDLLTQEHAAAAAAAACCLV